MSKSALDTPGAHTSHHTTHSKPQGRCTEGCGLWHTPPRGKSLRIDCVLSPEQVNHVAQLARLELTESETEVMAGELSKVLGYIEQISELDLTGVEPTSHVVDLVNALRADVPHESLPVEVALASAPEPVQGGFGVPSPGGTVE